MHIPGGAVVLLLAGGSPALGLQEETSKDQLILDLQKKIEALEARVQDIEATEPAPSAGLEARLDEVIHQSPSGPVREPMRLNFSAPGLERAEWTGRFRWRGAWWGNFNSPYTGNEDDILSFDQRLDLGMGFRLTEKTKLYAEIHDARVWGTEAPGSIVQDNDELASIHLDVSDFYGTGFDLRLGRQKVELGKERQIGEDDWLNTPTRVDGIAMSGDLIDGTNLLVAGFRLADFDSASVTEFMPGGTSTGTGAAARGIGDTATAELWVAYLTHTNDMVGDVEAYFMFVDADANSFTPFNPGTTVGGVFIAQTTRLYTYGARWEHGFEPIWWEAEAATQFGKINGDRTGNYGFGNWAVSARGGWKVEGIEFFDGVWVGYDYASGGSDAYVQLFPSLHGWFGIMDFASWSNIQQGVVGVTFDVFDGDLEASYRWLRLASGNSGFSGYNSAGSATGEKELGQELDVVYSVPCTDNSAADIGVGWFFPGDAYTDTFNSHSNVAFAYLQYGISF